MPLWKVYHPASAFSADDKKAMAVAITDVYGRVMPRFYVNVLFEPVPDDNLFIGGEPHPNFVRITVDHIAREFPSDKAMSGFMKHMNRVLKPWIEDRGFHWEMHVDETPFSLWTVQGHFPPREGTEDERRWIAENRPSARTHD